MNIKEKVRFGILGLAIFAVFAASDGVVAAHVSIIDMYLDGLEPRYCNVDWQNNGTEITTGIVTIELDGIAIYEKNVTAKIYNVASFKIARKYGHSITLNETAGTHIIKATIVSDGVTETQTIKYKGIEEEVENEDEVEEDWLQCP